MSQLLNKEKVQRLFIECLFRSAEDKGVPLIVENMSRVDFNSDRLAAYRGDIEMMLNELPDSFKDAYAQGDAFLSAGVDKNGQIWTDSYLTAAQLFSLGMGIGKVILPYPKEAWKNLSKGLPRYLIV